jgi:hypothetical protein
MFIVDNLTERTIYTEQHLRCGDSGSSRTPKIISGNFPIKPVTVAERSKACTVFARSEAVIVCSNPTQGMDV